MPRDLDDTIRKEAYYPDELISLGPMQLESRQVYDAEETGCDECKFGHWLKADAGEGTVWIAAPRQLREAISAIDSDLFVVTQFEEGERPHDEHRIQIEADPEQF